MKKGTVIIGIMFLSMAIMAQGSVIKKYFNELEDNENYTKVSVSQKMFSMFTELEAGNTPYPIHFFCYPQPFKAS